MDTLQGKVIASLPKHTLTTGIIISVVSTFAWWLVFVIIHYVLVMPFMERNKNLDWVKPFHKLKPAQKLFYSSYFHGIVHAIVSAGLALYCFFYADGTPHTNWFNDTYYKLTCFDLQKHCCFVTVGYFVYDMCFIIYYTDPEGD